MNFSGSLFLLSLLFPLISCKFFCLNYDCNGSNLEIKFPFHTAAHSIDCFYPAEFKLSCTKEGLTSINLPYSGEFLIRDINYQTQEIEIYDPKRCLAKRLLSLNLSDSVFNSPYYKDLTFLSCPANDSIFNRRVNRVIDCLSNSKNSTLATSPEYAIYLSYRCETIGTYKIPVRIPSGLLDYDYVIPTDILLTWDWPNCKKCEERGAKCSFDDHSYQVVCYDDPGRGKKMAKVIALCITIPVIFFVIFLYIYLRITRHPRNLSNEEIITIQPPNITPPTRGLDDSTIATYQQVTLGESKRLPGSGDDTCVICLSVFCAKDTIRVIPECNHCFHTTCIDEWLRMRGSCPVCRNSPLPAHVET